MHSCGSITVYCMYCILYKLTTKQNVPYAVTEALFYIEQGLLSYVSYIPLNCKIVRIMGRKFMVKRDGLSCKRTATVLGDVQSFQKHSIALLLTDVHRSHWYVQ